VPGGGAKGLLHHQTGRKGEGQKMTDDCSGWWLNHPQVIPHLRRLPETTLSRDPSRVYGAKAAVWVCCRVMSSARLLSRLRHLNCERTAPVMSADRASMPSLFVREPPAGHPPGATAFSPAIHTFVHQILHPPVLDTSKRERASSPVSGSGIGLRHNRRSSWITSCI
jgi:hypothetical protein